MASCSGRGGGASRRVGTEQAGEESSESDGETEPAISFHRRLSTNREIKCSAATKEGFLMKQTWSFQRWRRRYFKLKGHKLYYAKDTKAVIFDEIDLTDLSFAECSIKNVNHSFQVITPFRCLVLCAESRREMEDWISALKAASNREYYEAGDHHDFLSGHHHWYATSHARPTYCNVCREALSGVTSHGLSCEVCKCKVHKRCAAKAISNCKWTTLASIGKDIIEDEDGNITMPHQWMEGNLPVSAKCAVCDKTCGSVLRLQDWRCLWCRATVHTACRPLHPVRCPLGPCRVSVVPPTALHSIGSDEAWEAVRPTGCSPLLVFVNSKSGDNQGVKFLRRLKQLLNPAQVFDLISSGPGLGLRLFRHFDPFRILVCSGDGSVGWVLSEIDRLNMHKQCQVGVLPLGTGNDLARVLGWGSSCDDDTHLPQLLEKYEKACTKMLDRWSIMTFERSIAIPTPTRKPSLSIAAYEDSVVSHLTKILQSDQHSVVISSAKILCETVKDFTVRAAEVSLCQGDQQFGDKCQVLKDKLDLLLQTLQHEESGSLAMEAQHALEEGEEKSVLDRPEKGKAKQREALAERRDVQPEFFHPVISVIVNPPSPVMSDEGSETLTGKLAATSPTSGLHCSPAATRRISSGSLLKAPEAMAAAVRDRSRSLEKDNRTEDKGPSKRLPIINPLVRLPMWPNVSGGAGLVSKVLLANADALCAAASPLMDPDETLLEGYFERVVMNNYFGIGIDAKISLDFHQKREEHPEKCRSRAKNYMWYGVLGSKEWLQKTYKNLEQRVQLECDGQRIPLPSLQGIVILNIPSFMGGTNFWGGTKEDDCFLAPSFDDRILEVVAVFGSVQMAASRLINLQHHRIAQCQTVQITILGEEGVPIQVDGEAWVQPPGMIRIIHKNRMQMLCRNRALETSLRAWEEKQRHQLLQGGPGSKLPLLSPFSEEENQLLLSFIESVTTLVKYVKLLTIRHPSIEVELYQLAAQTAAHLEKVHPGGKIVEGPNLRPQVTELVSSARQLYEETCNLLREKVHNLKLREDLEGKLSAALGNMEMELRKCVTYDSAGLVHFQQPVSEEQGSSERKGRARGLFWLKFRRGGSGGGSRSARDVATWGVTEVATWLETLQLSEYAESFTRHDIRGRELLTLGRRDLKELGVTKVGHVKRILQAVRDLTM
ncbi:diacylglycerol kinase eta isoform X7 [Periplaneta americana]|uniref:diacylglycerol kinase eta isoform X7 n=1 Tax=Periplaneta americana TaxID=6978 RepID=UPI0037E918AD